MDELREKIADMICSLYRNANDPLCNVCKFDTHCGKSVMNTADQILALMPDIEQAKREERERIIKEVESKAMYFQGIKSGQGNLYIFAGDWQALKGGDK